VDIEPDGAQGQLRVLIVSTGDVCRGPAAVRILRTELDLKRPLTSRCAITSAGIRAPEGCDVHPLTARALLRRGERILGHEAMQLTEAQLLAADLVLTADRSQRLYAVRLNPSVSARLFTIKEFARAVRTVEPDHPAGITGPRALAALLDLLLGQRHRWLPRHPADDDIVDPITAGTRAHECSVDELGDQLDVCARLLMRCVPRTRAATGSPS
jgi:protein-tyrosine phosphatase